MRGQRLLYIMLIGAMLPLCLVAQSSPDGQSDFIDVNNILMWFSTNGTTSHNPITNTGGLEYPKGSGKYLVYMEGFVWGGFVAGDLRIGGSTFRTGIQPGKILLTGEADNTNNPRYRIYKLHRLTRDEYAQLPQVERDKIRTDFMNWPVEDGAPWIDANANRIYEPDFDAWLDGLGVLDQPYFDGDQVLWWVSNDLDAHKTNSLYGTPPVGLEVQTTVWGYDDPGTLGNTVFIKYLLLNKSNVSYNDVYLAKWVEPDVGYPLDDLVGIDTTCEMSYAYNSSEYDSVYQFTPPAIGYVLVQGPITPDVASVAVFNRQHLLGFKNLPLSSFASYPNSDVLYQMPHLGTPYGATMFYNNMQCTLWNEQPYVDPTTGLTVCPPFAGNPITRTGWYDGIVTAAGERAMMSATGPFDLFPGDTQEVVYAVTIAQGTDNMESLRLLFEQACELQSLYPQQVVVSAQVPQFIPESIEVYPVYPNPANDRILVMGFALQYTQQVSLVLTNNLGQKVATVEYGALPPGSYTRNIDTQALPTGAYTLTLRTKSGIHSQRIIIRK